LVSNGSISFCFRQYFGSGSGIWYLFDPLDPGWVKNPNPDPGSGMNIPDHIFESVETTSVADPDPPDPHVFGPPGFGYTCQRYGSGSGSGSGSFYYHAKIVRKTLIPTIL
jgi:hypothetical protein